MACLFLSTFDLRPSTFVQSKSASDLSVVQTCNAVSTQGTFAPQRMVTQGATTGSWAFSQTKNTTRNFEFYSNAGVPNSASWASGNWVVQLNVTTASGQADTWTATCVLRVNSAGTSQATVGSLTGQSVALNSTGVKSMTISGAAQPSASASDRIVVVMNFTTANVSPTTHSWTIDAGNASNDLVTAPVAVNFSAAETETNSTSDSPGRIARLHGGDTETVSASDSVARIQGMVAGLSETHAASDALGRIANYLRGDTETNSTGDSAARLARLGKTLAETLTSSDSATGQKSGGGAANYSRAIGENLTLSDAIARLARYLATTIEGLTPSDSVVAARPGAVIRPHAFASPKRETGGKASRRATQFKSPPRKQ